MTDTLTVKEHATEADLHGHIDNVLCRQAVVVVVFLFAIAEEPVKKHRVMIVLQPAM